MSVHVYHSLFGGLFLYISLPNQRDCARGYKIKPFYSDAHCTVRILSFSIENTFDFKIRTSANPQSIRTPYGNSHVRSMQFSACGKFPDRYKNSINRTGCLPTKNELSFVLLMRLSKWPLCGLRRQGLRYAGSHVPQTNVGK